MREHSKKKLIEALEEYWSMEEVIDGIKSLRVVDLDVLKWKNK